MYKIRNSKQYDLEDRTYNFAKNCRDFVKQIPLKITSYEYLKQLMRSSGSVAANYIEANEALSKKDFKHRIKICRKEAKESTLWLRLIITNNEVKEVLIKESIEIMKIFGAILQKCK